MRSLFLIFFCAVFSNHGILEARSVVYNFHNSESTYEKLRGDWMCIRVNQKKECTGVAMEEYFSPLGFTDLHITDDSIYFFQFPCVLVNGWSYRLQADSIYRDHSTLPLCKVEIIADTELHLLFPNCIVQSFYRKTFDPGIVCRLINDSINPLCMVGPMRLEVQSAEEQEQPNKDLPIKMPSTIFIANVDSANKILECKRIFVKVKRRKREFYITEITWTRVTGVDQNGQPVSRLEPAISLVPGAWWKGEKFNVRYISY